MKEKWKTTVQSQGIETGCSLMSDTSFGWQAAVGGQGEAVGPRPRPRPAPRSFLKASAASKQDSPSGAWRLNWSPPPNVFVPQQNILKQPADHVEALHVVDPPPSPSLSFPTDI